MSTTVTYRQAITRAMADAVEADGDVFLIGEGVAAAGGACKTTEGLLERFGPRRVRDTPISEQAIVGTAIGAAVQGQPAENWFLNVAGLKIAVPSTPADAYGLLRSRSGRKSGPVLRAQGPVQRERRAAS